MLVRFAFTKANKMKKEKNPKIPFGVSFTLERTACVCVFFFFWFASTSKQNGAAWVTWFKWGFLSQQKSRRISSVKTDREKLLEWEQFFHNWYVRQVLLTTFECSFIFCACRMRDEGVSTDSVLIYQVPVNATDFIAYSRTIFRDHICVLPGVSILMLRDWLVCNSIKMHGNCGNLIGQRRQKKKNEKKPKLDLSRMQCWWNKKKQKANCCGNYISISTHRFWFSMSVIFWFTRRTGVFSYCKSCIWETKCAKKVFRQFLICAETRRWRQFQEKKATALNKKTTVISSLAARERQQLSPENQWPLNNSTPNVYFFSLLLDIMTSGNGSTYGSPLWWECPGTDYGGATGAWQQHRGNSWRPGVLIPESGLRVGAERLCVPRPAGCSRAFPLAARRLRQIPSLWSPWVRSAWQAGAYPRCFSPGLLISPDTWRQLCPGRLR